MTTEKVRRTLHGILGSAGAGGYLVLAGAGAVTLATVLHRVGASAAAPGTPPVVVAQNEDEVSSVEIGKYVAVYTAMQRDHRLSVEQAAAAQGFTLQAFRNLEQRIERNDAAREQARRALAASAKRPASPGAAHAAPP